MTESLRKNPSETLEALIEPVQQVVKIAINKVREGEVDEVSKQKVALENVEAGKLYQIIDLRVKKTSEGVISIGDLSGGLFIREIILDENEKPVNEGLSIQAPRSEAAVNTRSIYLLRNLAPEAMDKLAKELEEAEVVSASRYQEAYDDLYGRRAGEVI